MTAPPPQNPGDRSRFEDRHRDRHRFAGWLDAAPVAEPAETGATPDGTEAPLRADGPLVSRESAAPADFGSRPVRGDAAALGSPPGLGMGPGLGTGDLPRIGRAPRPSGATGGAFGNLNTEAYGTATPTEAFGTGRGEPFGGAEPLRGTEPFRGAAPPANPYAPADPFAPPTPPPGAGQPGTAGPPPSDPPTGRRGTPRPRRQIRVSDLAERYALLALFLGVVLYFGLSPTTGTAFRSSENIGNILSSQTVLAILALGAILPLICGHFDLSVGAVAGLGSMVSGAAWAFYDLPLLVGVLLGVLAGALVGLLNGVVVTRLGVNSLITTLGTASIVAGLISWYSNGASITANIPPALVRFGSKNWLGLPRSVYLLVVVAVLAYYLLEHTPYGRHLRAIGVNPAAARLVGIRVDSLAMRAFVGSGAAAALAGVLLVAQAGAANPGLGAQFTLTALSAGFLGATAIRPGSFNVAGTLLAIYFLGASITGLTFAGARDYIGDLFTGIALVVAVAVSSVLTRRRARA